MLLFQYQIFAILFYFISMLVFGEEYSGNNKGGSGNCWLWPRNCHRRQCFFYLSYPFMSLPNISDYKHYDYTSTQCEQSKPVSVGLALCSRNAYNSYYLVTGTQYMSPVPLSTTFVVMLTLLMLSYVRCNSQGSGRTTWLASRQLY